MKKILFTIFIFLITIVLFAETYTIKNENMTLGFNVYENNNINTSIIKDNINGVDFILDPIKDKSLWSICVKKDKDYSGEEINLYPYNAKLFKCKENGDNIKLYWHNVKNDNMNTGFNVTIYVSLSKENSYWTIEVSPNKEYGIWTVTFPRISDINAQDGDELSYPFRSGNMIKEFSDPKGFPAFYTQDKSVKAPDMGFISPIFLQLVSFTKNNSTLYFSTEDINASMKSTNINLLQPNHFDYISRNFPENIAQANIGYKQTYKFNMAVIKGDWYNAAKKYRKWGIENKASIFAKGSIEEREDIPNWLKNNVCWLHYHGWLDTSADSVIKSQKFLDVPCACHAYSWSKYDYDTHYPNWLPESDIFKKDVINMQNAGIHVMPYTNGHIIDINQSPYYKKFGDTLLAKSEKGQLYYEDWAKDKGANNNVSCIRSKYYDALSEEICNIMKELNFDAIYIDQVGGADQKLCFNESHTHPLGGGDGYVKEYRKFLKELRTKLSKIKGAPVPFATEDPSESIPFDLWLRCNDFMPQNADYPVAQVIYSGYAVNFGDQNLLQEWGENDSIAAMNKTAISFVSGNQFGWTEGGDFEFDKYPTFAKFFKNTAKAREAGLKYFNLGELVRKVDFTNDIPKKEIFMRHFTGDDTREYPLVKTGSFNYKGKTCIAFTNISDESINVEWQSDSDSLGLVKKESYKLSEIYPTKSEETNINEIKGYFTIKPYETNLFVIE